MAITKVSPALIQVANNVTSTTIGNTTSIPSLTFDASGVIIAASNTTVTVANTNITGNIISSQIADGAIQEVNLDTGLKTYLTNMQDSIGLVQIRQITDGGFAFRGMASGVSDTFEDISGIDSANTLNLSFQSATDKFTANTFVSGTITTGANTQLGDNSAKTGYVGETSYYTFNSPSTNNITSGTAGGNQRLNIARQVDITGAFDLIFKYRAASVGHVGIYRASDESHIDTDNDLANHYGAGMFSDSGGHWTNGDPAGTVGYAVDARSSGNSYGFNPRYASITTVGNSSLNDVHKISREAGGAIKWYVNDVLKATSTTSTTAAMRLTLGTAGEGYILALDYLILAQESTVNITNVSNTTLVTVPTTASEVPTKSRVVLIAANNESITLNTELIASVSRDNGTTYTATTLSDQGVYANTGNVRIYTGEASLTGQPSGTTIRTKIETANNKNVEIHAYTTQWRSSV